MIVSTVQFSFVIINTIVKDAGHTQSVLMLKELLQVQLYMYYQKYREHREAV